MSHRILLSTEQYPDIAPMSTGSLLTLSESDSHYLNHVLRAKIGLMLILVDPTRGILAHAEVTATTKSIEVIVRSIEETPRYQSPVTSLLYPLTKGDTLDWVLEKGCEIGVGKFVLWQADRSVVKIENERDQLKKMIRWEKILRSAAQQSEKLTTPAIAFAPGLAQALALMGEERARGTLLQCSLGEKTVPLTEHLTKGRQYNIVIGPEGDFSPAENELLEKQSDLAQVSLGPFRLRSETAAITAVTLVCGISGFSLVPESP